MSYVKRILCLANSRKMSGRCVAGKEALEKGWGAWIRPISAREHEEVCEEERRYESGLDPRVGEIIDVPLLEARPRTYQQENHLLDAERYWVKAGVASWDRVKDALDPAPTALWENGHGTYNGLNDHIPLPRAEAFDRSLYLVEPETFKVLVQPEYGGKRKVRGEFLLSGQQYRLIVTDPVVERRYLAGANGAFLLDGVLLCISLGEPWSGSAYKLVATVITRARIEGTADL